jgi:pimeloyl-ACP methyl ester carboxylesterase
MDIRTADIRTARIMPVTRIAALALIAVAILGLAYLRFASGSGAVSVPARAKAGDLTLKPCDFPTERGSYPADCGTLVVPENRAAHGSRLIALPVIRIRAQSDHPGEPIFYLEGGPGLSNMTFRQASRYAHNRDVVLVGYRGVDGSVRLDCPEVESALKQSTDVLSQQSFGAYGDAFRACAKRLTDDGVDLAGYGLAQQIDDFEAARVALGYNRIDLLSQSAGTRTAMIYAWWYPTSINRSVMIGVNPPGHFLWDAQTSDEQIRRYAELCAKDSDCRQRTDDLAATMRRMVADMPDRWLFLPIKNGNVRVASSFGLAESTSKAGLLSAPTTLDAWLAAADGDPSGFWLQSVMGDVILPRSFVWGEYAAGGILDAQTARDYFASGAQDRHSIGYAESAFSWGGGRLADAWPAAPDENTYRQVRASNVETLLIGGELDTATPPQAATKELLPYLPNGHQVVLPGVGHIASFFGEQPEAGTQLINTFLTSGRVDTSLYKPQQVDFRPSTTAGAAAKVIAGTMLGLAFLTVLCLLWMAYQVRTRGRFGRRTSVAMRLLCPLVLGLGGWCLALLVVLTTMPGVSLDNQFLAVVSVGVPVSLVVCLAWVNRDWSTRTKATGFASAAAGTLLGAWLGLNATDGLAAVGTTIIAAAVGANLTLIVFDITRNHRARDRSVDAGEGQALAAHAATG